MNGEISSANDKIVLIGGGGHCRSVLDSIKRAGLYVNIVITDASIDSGKMIDGYQIVGSDDELPRLFREGYQDCFITIGSIESTKLRRKAMKRAEKIGFRFASIFDSTAVMAGSSRIGKGVFVGKQVSVNAGAVIGDFAILNTGCIVEHDCRIGEFTHIAVGAVVCGDVKIGDDCLIGANATIIQGVSIGDNAIIGAGSIVLKDVPDNIRVVGVWKD